MSLIQHSFRLFRSKTAYYRESKKGKRKDEIKHLIKEEAVKLYETKESEVP